MNELLRNILATIIAMVESDNTITIVTEDLLKEYLDDFKIRIEGRRPLNEFEKGILLEELENYFRADLNRGQDLIRLERGLVIADNDPEKHTYWEPDINSRFIGLSREIS